MPLPIPRPSVALRAAKTLTFAQRSAALSQRCAFSTTTDEAEQLNRLQKLAAEHAAEHAGDHAHEDHYDPPTGWLFGVKPGEKAEKEGWEGIWVWGFFGSLGLATVAYAFKPDTS
jgi:hypothetical protein